ncbi:hypothetical protein COY28_02340, partial [Candidatus Woesearchaeota archaeon CG_4_10_14_0_2_um_filter_57_5]
MAEETFVLVSLDEGQAQAVASVLTNQKARRILDHISQVKSATETEIAQALAMPLSTVHYNLGILKKSGLADAPEYHYSDKGKEVSHWQAASKYIVIAPKKTEKLGRM